MADHLTLRLLACVTTCGICLLSPPAASAQTWEVSPSGGFGTYEQPTVAYATAEDVFLVPMADHGVLVRAFDPDLPADGSPADFPSGYQANWSNVPAIFSAPPPFPVRSWPAVAYDPTTDHALVVFEQETSFQSGSHDIWAALCEGDGTCSGSTPFGITVSVHDDARPRVAFSPISHRYLVVWRRTLQRIGFLPNDQVWGRFLDHAGQPISREFLISDSSGFQARAPAVAYSPNRDSFLVVWEDQPAFTPFETDIAGCWLRADNGRRSAPFEIAAETGDQVLPRVAYDPDHEQYLIVWEDRRWDADIFGRRLHDNGAFLGATFAIAWAGANARTAPDVFYEPGTQVYRVVYEYAFAADDRDIRGRTVDAQGQLGASEAVHSSATIDECNPAIASRPSESMVVWQTCAESNLIELFNIVCGILW